MIKNVVYDKETRKRIQEKKLSNIYRQKFSKIFNKDETRRRVWQNGHFTGKFRVAAHSICNLRYKTPNEVHMVFHNGFNDDYHFIIKELAEEFYFQFECLEENTKKYVSFFVPIKKKKKERKKERKQQGSNIENKIH